MSPACAMRLASTTASGKEPQRRIALGSSRDRPDVLSLTKANRKFTWVVGGKTYVFCCPPCVEEFVRRAKEQPQEIKDPEMYVKR